MSEKAELSRVLLYPLMYEESNIELSLCTFSGDQARYLAISKVFTAKCFFFFFPQINVAETG